MQVSDASNDSTKTTVQPKSPSLIKLGGGGGASTAREPSQDAGWFKRGFKRRRLELTYSPSNHVSATTIDSRRLEEVGLFL